MLSVRVWSINGRWAWSVADEYGLVLARGRCDSWLVAYRVAHATRVRLHTGSA